MIIKKTNKYTPIMSAETIAGTSWYPVTAEEFKDYVEDNIENVFLKYTANYDNFEALDLDLMYGTRIVDDVLYICSSDGKDIRVGDEEVNPEFALDEYTPDELSAYMEDVTDKVLESHTTVNDFDKDLLKENLDNAAIEALQNGIDFSELIDYYDEIWK
jgi:hypothetical protein